MIISHGPMTADTHDAPAVLTTSLGAMLHARRAAQGLSLEELCRPSRAELSDLIALENGQFDGGAGELADLLAAYGIPRIRWPANRARLDVDLVRGSLSVVLSNRELPESPTAGCVLAYLELYISAFGMPTAGHCRSPTST